MRAPTLAGVATVRGARGAPGPTYTRARGTKNEPTSVPAPPSPYPSFIRRRSSNARWETYTDIVVFNRRQFVDENPKIAQAIVAALEEADRLIQEDPRRAAELYLAETREKLTVDELVEMMKQSGVVFSTTPSATMLMAEQMAKGGILKTG